MFSLALRSARTQIPKELRQQLLAEMVDQCLLNVRADRGLMVADADI